MSYLHPSQRAQTTAQIGPSGHSNNYHVGVLQGNWYEERFSFGPQPSSNFKFTATSEMHDKYPPRTGADFREAKPEPVSVKEAPRSLLMGQGKPVTSMQSVAELSFTDPSKGSPVLNTNQVLSAEGHSPRRTGTIGKRLENGTIREKDLKSIVAGGSLNGTGSGSAADEGSDQPAYLRNTKAEAHFLTTKNVTHDAAAEYMHEHPEVFTKGKCSSRGEVLKKIDDPMSRTGFRK